MSFKARDLALCVDARPTSSWSNADIAAVPPLREGAVYVVRAVSTCCCTRLALVGVGDAELCVCRCGAGPQALAWFAWRFIKAGEHDFQAMRTWRLSQRRDPRDTLICRPVTSPV